MKIPNAEFLAAQKLLTTARRIVIISHRGPDGDTVGANLALRRALQQMGGKEVISACVDTVPESNLFLPEATEYVQDFDLSWPDLLISVDCGSRSQVKFGEKKPELFSGKIPFLNIDHHASNDLFGTVNIVDAEAASACLVLYRLLKFCGISMDRQIATCLLHGTYYDTGSFMHSNTSVEVLQVAAELMWRGADFKTIVRKLFHTMPVPQLKIYGKILERARVNDKKITVSAVNDSDFENSGATPESTTGAIDYLNSVPDGDFSCLLYEDRQRNGDSGIKGSFRSRVDTVDLSRLAGVFGGGGHKKAAGFSFPGRLMEVGERVRIGA